MINYDYVDAMEFLRLVFYSNLKNKTTNKKQREDLMSRPSNRAWRAAI